MRIEDLRFERGNGASMVAATVIWEDCDRPAQDIYFETDDEFDSDLTCNPHAFLLACAIPAMRYRERRIFMDAEICPELEDGLMTAMGWLRQWYDRYDSEDKPIEIETSVRRHQVDYQRPRGTGFFLSGGIDSLATLRTNRIKYSRQHSGAINDGILIGGLEVEDKSIFKRVVESLSEVARDSETHLIPIYTNIRSLCEDWDFWAHEYQGAALSAVAHALAGRLSLVYIAASDHMSDVLALPLGSHPLIDPNYTSSDLRIKHDGIRLTRFAKTEIVAAWNVALQNIRVCTKSDRYQENMFNCGMCEKCIRTMLALEALGVLEQTHAFPTNQISPEAVLKYANFGADYQAYYKELLKPLAMKGRDDLVRVVRHKIAESNQPKWIKNWENRLLWPLIELDRRYFNARFKKLKKSILRKSQS